MRIDKKENKPAPMDYMSQFFSILAISQMLLSIALLAVPAKKNHNVQLFIALLLCGMGYLFGNIFSFTTSDGLWYWLTFIGGNALPGVFWLVSISIFSDHFVVRPLHYGLASSTMMLPLFSLLLQSVIDASVQVELFALIKYFAMLLELGFISHAIFIAVTGWRDDLVQQRRYIRGAMIVFSGIYILQVIVLGQVLKLDMVWRDQVDSVILLILMLVINYWLFQLRDNSLFTQAPVEKNETSIIKQENKSIKRIVHAMEHDCLYQQEGMTISELAKILAMHEYKLRNLINGELGYRNFNDFLNHYRIKEVAEKLQDGEKMHVPVLTFALESGFRSLSSFNKAFKLTHGLTPTEYRKKQNHK